MRCNRKYPHPPHAETYPLATDGENLITNTFQCDGILPPEGDGPYEATVTLKIKGTGANDQIKQMVGNVRRFVNLSVLPCEVAQVIVRRPDINGHSSIDPADIPEMKM